MTLTKPGFVCDETGNDDSGNRVAVWRDRTLVFEPGWSESVTARHATAGTPRDRVTQMAGL